MQALENVQYLETHSHGQSTTSFPWSKHNLIPMPKHNLIPTPKHNLIPMPKHNLTPMPKHNLIPMPKHNLIPMPNMVSFLYYVPGLLRGEARVMIVCT